MITVLFDGACGICRKEIAHYQRLNTRTEFYWLDLSQDPGAHAVLDRTGISHAQALYELHVIDHDGVVHKGVAAFHCIWRQFKVWRPLSDLLRLPVIRRAVEYLYTLFIRWRVARGLCTVPAMHSSGHNGKMIKE